MKKLLSMVLCAMMALTLAGCGGSSDDSSTYTYSSELDIKNLDSSDAEDGCSFTALHAIIDGLMKPAKDGTTTYGIAKSSEVSEDGLTHTYKLRDAKWSNGDAVTANDFVYAWQRIFKKKGNYYYMFCDGIANIAGAQELSDKIDAEQDLTDDDLNSLGVKAVDDKTLEITTTTRVSFFDELMSFPCFYPINEKFCEKQGDKYGKSADSILGNGAFVMTNWEPGSVAEFEKNDKFYAAKDVKIDKLVMKLVQEPKVAAQAFEAGETDFAIINSDLVDKYKKDESFKNISEGFLFYVQPNLENADLANLNVRKALSLAINRKDLCENVLKDGSQAAKGFVPSGLSISPEGKDFRDEKLKPADAPRILQDGRIDGFFYTVGHPNGNIKEATAGKRKVRIVPISEAEVASLLKEAPYYSMTEIPMDQYPDAVNAKDKVKTVGMLATLVTSADTPDDVVYAVTKEVMTNLDQFRKLHPALANLTPESMLQGLTAPIHPGALKYYKEAGLVK